MINSKTLEQLADNTFFTVKFVKNNGEVRTLNGRTGVKKYVNPLTKGESEKQKEHKEREDILVVCDNDIIKKAETDNVPEDEIWRLRPYRNVKCGRILEVKAKGLHLKRNSLEDNFEKL